MQRIKSNWLRAVVHLGAWLPLTWIIFDALTNHLGVEPIREIILRTGKTALVLLMLSLACTPLNSLLHFRPALQVRRALGLYAFFYALGHFFTFVVIDYALDWQLLQDALLEKPYALVGFAAFVILLPIAITSTKGWMKRLGKAWTKLHRGVYFAALLVIVHFVWLVKLDVREPLAYGLALGLLLLARGRPIRHLASRLRERAEITSAKKTSAPA